MNRYTLIVGICLTIVPSLVSAKTANEVPLDVSFKTGGHTGLITEAPKEKDGKEKSYTIGGVPLALVFNKDLTPALSLLLEVGILLDVPSQQVTKQGYYGGVAYHLMGGSRRIVDASDFAMISRSNPYNLSFVFMGGLQNFSASDPENTSQSVAGAIFEIVGGLQYRYDLWQDTSLGVEFLQILVTLPASTERLETVGSTFGFFWRTFI